jgi:hypothetical protein
MGHYKVIVRKRQRQLIFQIISFFGKRIDPSTTLRAGSCVLYICVIPSTSDTWLDPTSSAVGSGDAVSVGAAVGDWVAVGATVGGACVSSTITVGVSGAAVGAAVPPPQANIASINPAKTRPTTCRPPLRNIFVSFVTNDPFTNTGGILSLGARASRQIYENILIHQHSQGD